MANGNRFLAFVLSLLIVSTPALSYAGYTSAELNPLLDDPILMDISTCAQKYGEAFCKCTTLSDGNTGCFYQRPAEGFYTLSTCESIWGAGHCVCDEPNVCRLDSNDNIAEPLGCNGQIYMFPGEKFECRQSGTMTMWRNCCFENSETDQSCSFENVASELGWDDAAIYLMKTIAGKYLKEEIANTLATYAVQEAVSTGAFDIATSSLSTVFTDGMSVALSAQTGAASNMVSVGGTLYTQQAATAVVQEMFLTAFTWIGWAYTIYSLYQTLNEMTQCDAGEMILGCKRAKQVCHEVGDRCVMKVFGACFQEKSVFCCFTSVLSRIIHEQGRPQIGLSWGDGKSPNCRGFFLDEFAELDFSEMDFSEFAADLTRQAITSEQAQDKVEKIIEKYTNELVK